MKNAIILYSTLYVTRYKGGRAFTITAPQTGGAIYGGASYPTFTAALYAAEQDAAQGAPQEAAGMQEGERHV